MRGSHGLSTCPPPLSFCSCRSAGLLFSLVFPLFYAISGGFYANRRGVPSRGTTTSRAASHPRHPFPRSIRSGGLGRLDEDDDAGAGQRLHWEGLMVRDGASVIQIKSNHDEHTTMTNFVSRTPLNTSGLHEADI